ncbi:MAG: hypothetical protein V4476_11680 [Pseudomonadota bacterium]
METTFKPIDQTGLMELLAPQKSRVARAFGLKEGWYLLVHHGGTAKALASEDGGLRIFTTLEALDDYLRDHGIPHFLVDISKPDRTTNDPAVAERLREAQKNEEHNAWFRQQVQEALDDPSLSIPHSVVEEKFAARRTELLKKLSKV